MRCFEALIVVMLLCPLAPEWAIPKEGSNVASVSNRDALTNRYLENTYALLAKYDFRTALQKADYILTREPNSGRAHLFKGYALYKLERPDEAIIEIRRGLSLLPNQGKEICAVPNVGPEWTYHILICALQDSGKVDEAVKSVGEAIKIYGDKSIFYMDRGLLNSTQKKYDKAVADFTMFIKLEPLNHVGYFNRGRCYVLWQKPALAVIDLEKCLKLNRSEDGSTYAILGKAHTMLGRPDLAKKDFELSNKYSDVLF